MWFRVPGAEESTRAVVTEHERMRLSLRELLPRAIDAVISPSVGPISVEVPQGSSAGFLAASLASFPGAVDGSSLFSAVAPPVVIPQAESVPVSGNSVALRPAKRGRPRGTTPP